ncbi:MAG: helicase C-terminal domain-containing protein [Bacillota bacterium]|jgi:ATP-dependent DNA helicase DinG
MSYLMNYRPVIIAFDLETTGLSPGQDEIIELGAVRIEEGIITERYQTLVCPRTRIPPRISRLTGITQDMLDKAPPLGEVLPSFLNFLSNYPLVAHQASFDLNFLETSLGQRLSNEVLDTVELARLAFPMAANHRLVSLARELELTLIDAHRALADAEATALLFLKIDEIIKSWPFALVHQINQMAATFSWPLAGYFQYIEKFLTRHLKFQPVGSLSNYLAPVPAEASGIFAKEWEKTNKPIQPYVPVDFQWLESLFGPNGTFAQSFGLYEYRPQQITMLNKIAEAFNKEHHLLIEAGTGTGKSLAYLLPAVLLAIQNQDKVVISTHTIALQEQLWFKDIPQLREALKSLTSIDKGQINKETSHNLENFRVALVKGRGNYLCLRKWFSIEQNLDSYTAEEKRFFIRLYSWLSKTSTGDRSELNLNHHEAELWFLVAADSESCSGGKCPWFKNQCFIMRARRQCEEAHLLVINHSLLLADFKTDNQVLPAYSRVIIDEAHHLEDAATEHLGLQISFQSLIGACQGLHRQTRYGSAGLLINLKKQLNRLKWQYGSLDLESGEQVIESVLRDLLTVKEQAETFFGIIMAIVNQSSTDSAYYNKRSFRFRKKNTESKWWTSWIGTRDNLIFQLNSLHKNLKLLEDWLEYIELAVGTWIGERKDLQARRQFFNQFMNDLQFITAIEEEHWVYWAEIEERRENHNTVLRAAPIEVAELLNKYLFAVKKTVILTSATLRVSDSFNHFIERVGLALTEADKIELLHLDSPFAYEKQALLCIPRELPNPAVVGDRTFSEAISPILEEVIEATAGRTMVLFTSHNLLRQTYSRIKNALEAKGINLLGHNIDGGYARLVEEFRTTPRSVLFGASTLWEGVDIQGEELSCVVLVKLPFLPPNLPIVEARIEAITRRNRKGFYHYTLPEAILRMRQGFGRLIRSKSDRGVVVILDNRIIEKKYGQEFLKSFPLKTHVRINCSDLKETINAWLNKLN